MKGIILAGGSGTRLHPLTIATSKQLLPVYDKPMIYYPLSTLMLAGVREVLVVTTPHEAEQFKRLLGDGSQWGIAISYAEQAKPNGLAEAFIIGEDFIGDEPVALILGDNIFYGPGMGTALASMAPISGASVFGYEIADPTRYGVIEVDKSGFVLSIEEKPVSPRSSTVITGLYFCDSSVIEKAKSISPSSRGELEIVDLLDLYRRGGELRVKALGPDITWLDAGTIEALHDAANRVEEIEKSAGRKINVPEEVAWRMGYISDSQLASLAARTEKSAYGTYLQHLLAK